MDYTKHYNTLIDRARNRHIMHGYYEAHHIEPKSRGGDDSATNIVMLTSREHFIAHQLLVHMYPNDYGLAKAARMMCYENPHHKTK